MPRITPDPSFYPTAGQAATAPAEQLAYVATIGVGENGDTPPDAIGVIDLNRESESYDPLEPKLVKTIEPEEIAKKTGYSRAHTVHCGPDGIYVNALGDPDGDGPGGIFVLDHDTFEVKGAWERDRGPQELAYDFWWHLGYDRVVSSEWGTPNMVEAGVNPELLLGNEYGHRLHVWDMKRRRHLQEIDLGAEHQMALELRPAHDPGRAYGFVGTVVSTADLSASVFLWEREADGTFAAEKVITVPAEPADADQL